MVDFSNLDALIPREDFEVETGRDQDLKSQTITIKDLEKSAFFYNSLRKPDFQRETSAWTPEKVVDFTRSFLDGDLIPAIILWNSSGYIFTIDGAHRLSALIAWTHDDYGDDLISQKFFEHNIEDEQKEIGEKTRKLIKNKIGTYKEYLDASKDPLNARPEILTAAKKLGYLAVQLQWVNGDAKKAEDSFFKINQKATPIDKTEIRLLKSRDKPSSLAARAIMRSGTGHKYWSKFSYDVQEEIEKFAKEINDILFNPPLKTPIKTLDLPIAGRRYSYQALPLILNVVNITNNVKSEADIEEDKNGHETIKFLKKTMKIINRISGIHASSLGLHPVVYFYSKSGKHQHTAFLSIIELLRVFEKNNSYNMFIKNRQKFEDFILKHKDFQNEIAYKYRGNKYRDLYLKELYEIVLEEL